MTLSRMENRHGDGASDEVETRADLFVMADLIVASSSDHHDHRADEDQQDEKHAENDGQENHPRRLHDGQEVRLRVRGGELEEECILVELALVQLDVEEILAAGGQGQFQQRTVRGHLKVVVDHILRATRRCVEQIDRGELAMIDGECFLH